MLHTIQRLTSRHLSLDPAQSGLIAVQEYRSAVVTAHRPRSAPWRWAAAADARATTIVIFPSDGSLVFAADDRAEPTRVTGGILLHSSHTGSITWNPGAAATIVWVETDSVLENGVTQASTPLALPANALTAGYRAFAEAVVQGADRMGPVSTYFVERLLLEMALGIMLEQSEIGTPAPTADRPIQRARTLMLLNHHDPAYGVDELAADMHVSLRQLQRIFSAEGTVTPAGALRMLRVEFAEAMLRNPQYDVLSVTQVAGYAGFASAATMRRSLRENGRMSPQAMRRRG